MSCNEPIFTELHVHMICALTSTILFPVGIACERRKSFALFCSGSIYKGKTNWLNEAIRRDLNWFPGYL